MPKSARALSHAPEANDSPAHIEAPAHSSGKRSPARQASNNGSSKLAKTTISSSNLRHEARPLLIGAGVGAAVALSVVALRNKERPPTLALFANANPDFLSVLVKAAVFAIGRSSARNTFAGVVARAVGQAVTSK